jgi:hypothetical protein
MITKESTKEIVLPVVYRIAAQKYDSVSLRLRIFILTNYPVQIEILLVESEKDHQFCIWGCLVTSIYIVTLIWLLY